jgi:hypothetical protein
MRERTFIKGVRSVFKAAEANPDAVILLGRKRRFRKPTSATSSLRQRSRDGERGG